MSIECNWLYVLRRCVSRKKFIIQTHRCQDFPFHASINFEADTIYLFFTRSPLSSFQCKYEILHFDKSCVFFTVLLYTHPNTPTHTHTHTHPYTPIHTHTHPHTPTHTTPLQHSRALTPTHPTHTLRTKIHCVNIRFQECECLCPLVMKQ